MANDKIAEALGACEKVINGIERDDMNVSTAALCCMRIARLTNDEENFQWLLYETGGYPKNGMNSIKKDAWEIAYKKGRSYTKDGEENVFIALAPELEDEIETSHLALENLKMEGVSVAGEYALGAMGKYVSSITGNMATYMHDSAMAIKRLNFLKAQYYQYAVKKQIELKFANISQDIFEKYRDKVDNHFSELSMEAMNKLQALEGKLDTDNPEFYAEAAVTCRRLWENVADELFEKYYPELPNKIITKSGAELVVSRGHSNNRLSAVIEKLEEKTAKKTLVGSSVIYLVDWLEQINDGQNAGVHSEITKDKVERCIIHTYILLGDILRMQE